MRFLFAHISWLAEYSGRKSEPIISSTHGYVLKNNDAGERSNFKEVGRTFYGYVPVAEKPDTGSPGEIHIERLGGKKRDEYVDDITVVWFANDPRDLKTAYIVGWYRNARVFRDTQSRGAHGYRISCANTDATLLDESARKFPIPHARSKEGQNLGYGYGQSSIWYADKAPSGFLDSVTKYIDSVDVLDKSGGGSLVAGLEDAIDDFDQSSLGNESPERRKFAGTFIVRDNRIRAKVIKRAKGRCEHCGELGFKKPDGSHFVEAHHIISLAEQGPDTLENVIALCPNHHRQAHYGADWEDLETQFKIKLAKIRGS
jgi:HNH endonuclease